jgi:hypothetical protein
MKLKRGRRQGSGNELAGGCLSLFGLPFLLAGLVMTVIYFSGFLTWWDARSWAEVPCQIDSAELEESHGSDSTTYRVEATFHYDFNGRSYQSDQVSLGKGGDNVGDFHHRAHRELSSHLESGRAFRCFVDPDAPENAVLYRRLRWEMQAFMAIFALTFPAVGVGLVVGGIIGGRATKRQAVLTAAHPQEPWKWKESWAGAAIPEQAGRLGSAFDLYTLWSALVIFPLIGAAAVSGAFGTDKWAWVLGIFGVIWCVPAGFTLKRIRKRRVVGKTELVLSEMPAWPGGRLAGNIVLERPVPALDNPELVLTCEKLTTRSTGDGSSTTREQVWQGTQTVPRDGVTRGDSGYRVPLGISIPPDAPVTGATEATAQSHVRHEWTLRLRLPSSKVAAMFDVPVFATGQAPVALAAQTTPTVRDRNSHDLPQLLAARKIVVEFATDGTPVSIVCPPARNLGMLVFLFLFNLVWTGAAVLLVVKDAPLMFRVIWIGSAAGIWVTIIYQLIHGRRVTVSASEIVVANSLGPWTRTARRQRSEIAGFSHGSGGSSGNTTFYRVQMEDVFGKTMTLVDNITEVGTAQELVRRMETWWNNG